MLGLQMRLFLKWVWKANEVLWHCGARSFQSSSEFVLMPLSRFCARLHCVALECLRAAEQNLHSCSSG